MRKDLKSYIENNLEGIVESNIDAWKDTYFRKSLECLIDNLKYNYDFSGDIETIEDTLKRPLSDCEAEQFKRAFIKEFKKSFYQNGPC